MNRKYWLVMSNSFTGPSSTTVEFGRAEYPAERTSAAVTPDKGPSQQRHRLNEEAKGKPSLAGTSFDLTGMKIDFFCTLIYNVLIVAPSCVYSQLSRNT